VHLLARDGKIGLARLQGKGIRLCALGKRLLGECLNLPMNRLFATPAQVIINF
jgi:hypothetical protein